MQILEHKNGTLLGGFAQQQGFHRIDGTTATLGRIKRLPAAVFERNIEKREKGWQGWRKHLMQGGQLRRDLRMNSRRAVVVLETEIGPQQINDRQPRCGFTVGDRKALDDSAVSDGSRSEKLMEQSRFAGAGAPDHRDDLAVTVTGQNERFL